MNLDIHNALINISKYYNIDLIKLKHILESNSNNTEPAITLNNSDDYTKETENTIILPYYGKIIEDNCKGIVYNHGLFTQCNEKNRSLCSKCIKNKYGTIHDRKNFALGKYIAPNGKKEIDYNLIINRLNYNINDVVNEFKKYNINTEDFNIKKPEPNIKKGRGRPKKIQETTEENETIDVIKYLYNDQVYFKTNDNILLDVDTYDVLGYITKEKVELLYK